MKLDKAIKYSIRLYVLSQPEKKKYNTNVSNIFKVKNKYTRTTNDASIINFEHISHFILLLLLLHSNK